MWLKLEVEEKKVEMEGDLTVVERKKDKKKVEEVEESLEVEGGEGNVMLSAAGELV